MQAIPLSTLPQLQALSVQGRRVLLRVDYNDGGASDLQMIRHRLAASLPTLEYLLQNGARVGILTHRGRPQGRVVPELSTAPLAEALSQLLGKPIPFVPDCVGRMAEQAMDKLPPGQAVMLENTRFYLGEQLNQQPFAAQLANLGDVLVNDAFACAHRTQASTHGLVGLLPSALGFQFVQELQWLERWRTAPRPRVMLMGGNTVLPKLELLQSCLNDPAERLDVAMLGGVVGQTFLAAKDLHLRQSLIEYGAVDVARNVLAEAGVLGCRVHLPRDFRVADKAAPTLCANIRRPHELLEEESAQDLGPVTTEVWQRVLTETPSVLWFGSVGVWQHPAFMASTKQLAETLLEKHRRNPHAFALLAGNGLLQALERAELRAPLQQAGVVFSTGGGALQQALCGHPLPGVQVLIKQ